jgi:hypothetical protein
VRARKEHGIGYGVLPRVLDYTNPFDGRTLLRYGSTKAHIGFWETKAMMRIFDLGKTAARELLSIFSQQNSDTYYWENVKRPVPQVSHLYK